MGNVFDSGYIILLWNLSLIEEDVLERVWNLNSFAASRCVDVECCVGWHRLCLDSWLHLGLGRCRCLESRTKRTAAWGNCRC